MFLELQTIQLKNYTGTTFIPTQVCCADKRSDQCPMSYIEVLIAPNRKWVPATITRQNIPAKQVTLCFGSGYLCTVFVSQNNS